MKFLRASCFGLVVALCVSCVHFHSRLSTAAKPDKESAILYGRLYLKPTFSAGLKIALWLQNAETHQSIYIPFKESEPLCAIRIKPGKYQVMGLLGSDRTHTDLAKQAFTEMHPGFQLDKPFTAGPGSQTYLGDYGGEATLYGFINQFYLTGPTNKLAAATEDFCEKYPKLATSPALSMFQLQEVDT
jgi:hypothetical protein